MNLKTIRNKAKAGDILLGRSSNDTLMIKNGETLRSNWQFTYLCVGKNKFIKFIHGDIYKFEEDNFLRDGLWDLGLFRATPELTNEEVISLLNAIRAISIDCCYMLDTPLDTEQITAAAYEQIGISLHSIPIWQTQPVDFDESSRTVRIL
jgi:hypothetical protein